MSATPEPTSLSETNSRGRGRGGRGRGGRSRGEETPAVRLSRTLSWILRHGANQVGLAMAPDGFVLVEELLALAKMKGTTLEELRQVVETNDKQRFTMRAREADGKLIIRANQGHSIKVHNVPQ